MNIGPHEARTPSSLRVPSSHEKLEWLASQRFGMGTMKRKGESTLHYFQLARSIRRVRGCRNLVCRGTIAHPWKSPTYL